MVELSPPLQDQTRSPAATIDPGTLRIGDYEVRPSAAAERDPTSAIVWYGSAVARRVADGGAFNAAFDYYNVPFPSEGEALAFAVQRTTRRLLVTFGPGVHDVVRAVAAGAGTANDGRARVSEQT